MTDGAKIRVPVDGSDAANRMIPDFQLDRLRDLLPEDRVPGLAGSVARSVAAAVPCAARLEFGAPRETI